MKPDLNMHHDTYASDCFKAFLATARTFGLDSKGSLDNRAAPFSTQFCKTYHEHPLGEYCDCAADEMPDDQAYGLYRASRREQNEFFHRCGRRTREANALAKSTDVAHRDNGGDIDD